MDRSDRLPKHLVIALGMAVAIYAFFFSCDQHIRARKGPWQVVFGTNDSGWASVRVNQPFLNIETTLVFIGEKATNEGVVFFDKPSKAVPFGRVKFEDLTYLPGSVAFDFFGHEVELLPRTLYLNKREYPWKKGDVHELVAESRLPPGMSYDPHRKKRL